MARLIVAAILISALVGCGQSANPTAATSPSAAPSASAALASGAAAPGEMDLCARDNGCPLVAGAYAPTKFKPPLRFVVGTGWWNDLHVADCITLFRDDSQKLFFMSGVTALGRTPDDLLLFARNEELTVSSQTAVRVAGRDGVSIDITTAMPKTLFPIAGMGMGLDPRQRARLIGVPSPLGEGLFAILVRSSGPDFDQFMPEAQKVIDTLQFR